MTPVPPVTARSRPTAVARAGRPPAAGELGDLRVLGEHELEVVGCGRRRRGGAEDRHEREQRQ